MNVTLILDNIRSAYNVGAMFRTADAVGASRLMLCGITAHPPNAKLEKTALGAIDVVPWSYHAATAWAIDELRAAGVAIVGLEAAPGATPIHDFAWPDAVALVVGNEVTGISREVLARCDAVVAIPMVGVKNSLNVASAAAIALYEIRRDHESRKIHRR
ncbi:MAG: RNA methyltransferase [Deltaproteobacteria bacterium]|nr:RNA methyltransferase [Deltaproteobacteria bacterium]